MSNWTSSHSIKPTTDIDLGAWEASTPQVAERIHVDAGYIISDTVVVEDSLEINGTVTIAEPHGDVSMGPFTAF